MSTILVTQPSIPPLEEYVDEIRSIWESHWLTNMGVKHRELQERLKDFLGVQNIDLFTNGHMALEFSMQAMKLTGEVITTPFTFASTTHAIVRNGLTPVFCDINPTDFTIDVNQIESLITDKTTAIAPVHVYGNVCDVEAIEAIAKRHDLKVIYDAAHAFGVRYKGRGVACYGDVSCFSFHATKVFNTIEGGAACFSDALKDFGLDLYRLKNFGIRGPECVDAVGANAKMNEFCAAMGLCNLRHLAGEIEKRRQVVATYRSLLEGVDGLQLSPVQKDVKQNYAYFPVVFDKKVFGATRNDVMEALSRDSILARKYFYPITNTFECYRGRFAIQETPVALRVSRHVLTLPLYADLPLADAKRIAQIVLSCRKTVA